MLSPCPYYSLILVSVCFMPSIISFVCYFQKDFQVILITDFLNVQGFRKRLYLCWTLYTASSEYLYLWQTQSTASSEYLYLCRCYLTFVLESILTSHYGPENIFVWKTVQSFSDALYILSIATSVYFLLWGNLISSLHCFWCVYVWYY